MGSGVSSLLMICNPPVSPGPGLGDLPESVVGTILEKLNVQEICRLAAVNRAFCSASSADFVWELKLPENYKAVVSWVFEDEDGGELVEGLCKKDVYAKLAGVNSVDGDTKKVWLHKGTGKPCVLTSFNGLSITGIDDRRYWSRISTDESRFGTVAYLQQIWWFEVDGEVEFPFPVGTYSLYFRVQLGRPAKQFGWRVCNLEHVHGWDKKPVRFQLSTSDGQKAISETYLTTPGTWNLYHAGDFVVKDSRSPMKVKFSMMQIDCTHTKGGLCVDSVLICPK